MAAINNRTIASVSPDLVIFGTHANQIVNGNAQVSFVLKGGYPANATGYVDFYTGAGLNVASVPIDPVQIQNLQGNFTWAGTGLASSLIPSGGGTFKATLKIMNNGTLIDSSSTTFSVNAYDTSSSPPAQDLNLQTNSYIQGLPYYVYKVYGSGHYDKQLPYNAYIHLSGTATEQGKLGYFTDTNSCESNNHYGESDEPNGGAGTIYVNNIKVIVPVPYPTPTDPNKQIKNFYTNIRGIKNARDGVVQVNITGGMNDDDNLSYATKGDNYSSLLPNTYKLKANATDTCGMFTGGCKLEYYLDVSFPYAFVDVPLFQTPPYNITGHTFYHYAAKNLFTSANQITENSVQLSPQYPPLFPSNLQQQHVLTENIDSHQDYNVTFAEDDASGVHYLQDTVVVSENSAPYVVPVNGLVNTETFSLASSGMFNVFIASWNVGDSNNVVEINDNYLESQNAYFPGIQTPYKTHCIFSDIGYTSPLVQNTFNLAYFVETPHLSKWNISGPFYPNSDTTSDSDVDTDIQFLKVDPTSATGQPLSSPMNASGDSIGSDVPSANLIQQDINAKYWVLGDQNQNAGEDQFVPILSGKTVYNGKIFYKIIGSTGALNPGDTYLIEYKAYNEGLWHTIKSGSSTITNNTLAYWDVTRKIGQYSLKFTSFTSAGSVKESVVNNVILGQKVSDNNPISDPMGIAQLNFPKNSLNVDKIVQISQINTWETNIFNASFQPVGPIFNLTSYTADGTAEAPLTKADFKDPNVTASIQITATLRELGLTAATLSLAPQLTIYSYNSVSNTIEDLSAVMSPTYPNFSNGIDTVVTLTAPISHFSTVFIGNSSGLSTVNIYNVPQTSSGGQCDLIITSTKALIAPVTGSVKLPNGQNIDSVFAPVDSSNGLNVYKSSVNISGNMQGSGTINAVVYDQSGNTITVQKNFDINSQQPDVLININPGTIASGNVNIDFKTTKRLGSDLTNNVEIDLASFSIKNMSSQIKYFNIYKDNTEVDVNINSKNTTANYFIDSIPVTSNSQSVIVSKGRHSISCSASAVNLSSTAFADIQASYIGVSSTVTLPNATSAVSLALSPIKITGTNIDSGEYIANYIVPGNANEGSAQVNFDGVKYDGSDLNETGSFNILKSLPVVDVVVNTKLASIGDFPITIQTNRNISGVPGVVVYPANNTGNAYNITMNVSNSNANTFTGIFSINNNISSGAYNISATCIDIAGNTGTGFNNFTIQTKPPTINLAVTPKDIKDGYVYITITSDVALPNKPLISVQQNGFNQVIIKDNDVTYANNAYYASYKVFPGFDGQGNITVQAFDITGNTGTASAVFNVSTSLSNFTITTTPQYINSGNMNINLTADRNLAQSPDLEIQPPGSGVPIKVTLFAQPASGSTLASGNIEAIGVTLAAVYCSQKIKIDFFTDISKDVYPADGSWNNKVITINGNPYNLNNLIKVSENGGTSIYIEVTSPYSIAIMNNDIKLGSTWQMYNLSNGYTGTFVVDNTMNEGAASILATGYDSLGNQGRGTGSFTIDRTSPTVSLQLAGTNAKLNTPLSATITVSEKTKGIPVLNLMSSVSGTAKNIQVLSSPDQQSLIESGALTQNASIGIEAFGNSLIAKIFSGNYDKQHYYNLEGKQININNKFYQMYNVGINTLSGVDYLTMALLDSGGNIVSPTTAGITTSAQWSIYDTIGTYNAAITMNSNDPSGSYTVNTSVYDSQETEEAISALYTHKTSCRLFLYRLVQLQAIQVLE